MRQKCSLTKEALKAINNPTTRREIMDALGCTEFTVARYIQKASENLTKHAVLQIVTKLLDKRVDQVTELQWVTKNAKKKKDNKI